MKGKFFSMIFASVNFVDDNFVQENVSDLASKTYLHSCTM